MRGFFIIFLSLISFTTFSQSIDWGIKAGVNMGALIAPVEEGSSGQAQFGPLVGISAAIPISEKIGLEAVLQYVRSGVKFQSSLPKQDTMWTITVSGMDFLVPATYRAEVDGQMWVDYLDVPLSFYYQFGQRMRISTGPRVAYLLNKKFDGTSDVIVGDTGIFDQFIEEFEESALLHNFDFGWTLGSQYQLFPKLALDFKIESGITPLNDTNDQIKDQFRSLFFNFNLIYSIFKHS